MHDHDHAPGAHCGCSLDKAFGTLIRPGDHSHVTLPRRAVFSGVSPGSADLIIKGRIVTMNPELPVVEAAAVKDGRITALGVKDLAGKSVLRRADCVTHPA